MSFVINKDAVLPVIQRQLTDENGDIVPLDAAVEVILKLRRVGTETDTTFTAEFVDRVNGVVKYEWQSGDTTDAGDYESVWVVDGMSYPNGSYEPFVIYSDETVDLADLYMCSAADARKFTRKDIDLDDLMLAHNIIELYAGLTVDVYADLYDQDKLGLRQAVAFQAAWLEGQYDFLTRMDVSAETADGETRNYNANALALAPMAQWALTNTRFAGQVISTINTASERHRTFGWLDLVDNNRRWRPLRIQGWQG